MKLIHETSSQNPDPWAIAVEKDIAWLDFMREQYDDRELCIDGLAAALDGYCEFEQPTATQNLIDELGVGAA
jgi:hypothetical protein